MFAFDRLTSFFGVFLFLREIDDRDVGAFPRGQNRDGTPDTGVAPGDDSVDARCHFSVVIIMCHDEG